MSSSPWVPPTPTPPLYRRRPFQVITLLIVIAVVVVLVILLTGGSEKRDIDGSFRLTGKSQFTDHGSYCTGNGAYSGLKIGGFVTLYGDNQDYISSGTLQPGVMSTDGNSCTFNFDLGKVSTSASSYTAVVAHDFRSTKSKADLKALGWSFFFQVGA